MHRFRGLFLMYDGLELFMYSKKFCYLFIGKE